VNTLRIVGQPQPTGSWLHRFRNFGEEVYVELRDSVTIDIKEIDAATDVFHVKDVQRERLADVTDVLTQILRKHHLQESVFIVPTELERAGSTVMLVLDPAFGDQLFEIVGRHAAWVTPSDVNRVAVEGIWQGARECGDRSSVTIWSAPVAAATQEDWIAILEVIELHHGEWSSELPMDTLTVYGAEITPAIAAALSAYDYTIVKPAPLGFLAMKPRAAEIA
jgi:hypothetical protein